MQCEQSLRKTKCQQNGKDHLVIETKLQILNKTLSLDLSGDFVNKTYENNLRIT